MNIDQIISKIKDIEDKGTQTNPQYYCEVFYEIMKFGGLSDDDIKRFVLYFPIEFNHLIKDEDE